MFKSKSKIGLMSDHSTQSSKNSPKKDTRRGNSIQPSPLDFDAFVPWICTQWRADDLVAVKIIHLVIEEYGQSGKIQSGKSKSSRNLKAKTRKSVDNSSPALSPSEKVTADETDTSSDVPVTAYYDNHGRLVSISIRNYNLDIPQKVIQAFSFCASYHHYLTKFSILRCSLTSRLVFEISSLLFNSNITDICLDGTFIPEGNYYILLDEVSQLRYLSLNGCKINNDICGRIVQRIDYGYPAARTLKVLDLGSNFISDKGATSIGEMLRRNRHLLHINLAGNKITDEGFAVILNALKQFPLTRDEIIEMRRERLRYIKNKTAVYSRCLQEVLHRATAVATLSVRTGKSTTNVTKNASKMFKGSKMLGSFQSKKNIHKEVVGDPEEIAEIMTNGIVGDFQGPYGPKGIVAIDGYFYAKGNFTLCSINLAYNNLEYPSVKKLYEVLTYQSDKWDPPGTGLLRIVLDGNYIPNSCAELDSIEFILKKKIIDSSVRKRTPSHPKMKHHPAKFS